MPITNFGRKLMSLALHPCLVCGKTDDEKPMCYRGEPWCCDEHRKIVAKKNPSAKVAGE